MVTEKLGRATLTGNKVTHISSGPLSSQRLPLGIPIQIIKGLLTWRWGTTGRRGNLPGHKISYMVTPSTYHVNVIKMRDDMSKRVTQPKRITSPTWGPPPCLVAVACFSFPFPSFPARFLPPPSPPRLPNLHSKETGLCRPGREPLRPLLLHKTSRHKFMLS